LNAAAPARPVGRTLRGDPLFWLAVAAGPAAWMGLRLWLANATLPEWPPALWSSSPLRFALAAALYPVLEEIVFRGGLQPWIATALERHSGAAGLVGADHLLAHHRLIANVLTSIAFAAAHLYGHPAGWALATFFPSLVFGFFRDRYGGLAAPIALHVLYNAGYFGFVA
jgi:membrane protease YdiL (CAAX protease family)